MPKAAQFLPDAHALKEDKGIDLNVYQCSGCGLVQINNQPVPYYKEVVRAAAFSNEMRVFRQKQFTEFVQRYALQKKKFVEIGCGRGEYLTLFQEAGVLAYGVEYAGPSVQHCVNSGLRVTQGFVDAADYMLSNAPFDGFAILNFLEHWPDPNSSLRGIAHNLRDGGIGLVEVPNLDMILRKNLFSEFISDHIFYFTHETLETTLRLNGFEVLECSEIWYDYIISVVVRKRRACDVSSFESTRQRLKSEIDDYIRKYGSGDVAIWGAGHQALAIIALLGLAGKVKYVVDSAPFKQNRFTPVSHIPIVPPEWLRTEPVRAVIVMAASYSDEVAKAVHQQFRGAIAVAILRDYGLEYACF